MSKLQNQAGGLIICDAQRAGLKLGETLEGSIRCLGCVYRKGPSGLSEHPPTPPSKGESLFDPDTMNAILKKLEGGDRRSIGNSQEVVAAVLADPSLFGAVFEGILATDPILRVCCADAVEKIALKHPEYLGPFQRPTRMGSPAMKSRGRKLLEKLKGQK